MAEKITATVTLKKTLHFDNPYAFDRTTQLYIFEAEDGTRYTWKTSTWLDRAKKDENGTCYVPVLDGDTVTIKGTVKERNEYKGEPQTVLTRVSVIETIKTADEKREDKREKQAQSICFGDQVLTMPYRQYKQHYSDCETVIDSYDDRNKTIDVIVRKGRLKPSGVRWEHFYKFCFKNGDRFQTYTAVCQANAAKRLNKEYPGESWELYKVYR